MIRVTPETITEHSARRTKSRPPSSQKGRTGKNEVKNATKRELARVRATEIMLIFFGIHTANVVNLARRESVQVTLAV